MALDYLKDCGDLFVQATNDYNKDKQFRMLRRQNEDHQVRVFRDSSERLINAFDVTVGDILILHAGDKIAADGLFFPILEGGSWHLRCSDLLTID